VPQPTDNGEVMTAALETTGAIRLFGLPHATWNLMVLACSIRSDDLPPPTGLDDLDRFASSIDLWPEITGAERWQRHRARTLDRLTRRASIVWSRGAAAAAEVLDVDPSAAELAAHLITVPTDLVLWVLSAVPVPHVGIRRTLLAELPRRIGAGLGHLADFPEEPGRVLDGREATRLGACLHVSRSFVPSSAVWPQTVPGDDMLLEIATIDELQRAAEAAHAAVGGLTGPAQK